MSLNDQNADVRFAVSPVGAQTIGSWPVIVTVRLNGKIGRCRSLIKIMNVVCDVWMFLRSGSFVYPTL